MYLYVPVRQSNNIDNFFYLKKKLIILINESIHLSLIDTELREVSTPVHEKLCLVSISGGRCKMTPKTISST